MDNKTNNRWKIKIYMLTIIGFMVGTSQFVISGILDKVSVSVGVSVSLTGQLITAYALANAIGTPIIMMATSKIGQRRQLLLSLTVFLIGMIATIVLPGFTLLVGSRVITGVAAGVFSASAYAMAAKIAPNGYQGRAMSTVAMGYSASLVLGVPIGRAVSAILDWRMIFFGIGLFCLAIIFPVSRTIPSMKSESPTTISEQLALLKNPNIAINFAVTLFVFAGYSVVNTYVTPFISATMNVSEHEISIILFVLGIASIFGSKFGGFLGDRIGATYALLVGMIGQVIALILVSVFTKLIIVTIALLIIWMTCAWIFGSTMNFNVVSRYPEAAPTLIGLNTSFCQLGFAAGAALGGVAIGTLSITSISYVGAVSVVLAVICFGFAVRHQKTANKALEG